MLRYAKKIAVTHLEPRFYGALWFAGGALVAAMVTLTYVDRALYREEIIFLGALLAMALATIGWIWSGRMSLMQVRKTNALALLERLSSEHVSALKIKVYAYIADYNEFQEADCDKARPAMPESEIEQLLSIYEQASVAIVHSAVDHDILKHSQFMVFKRIYLGLRHHVDKVQKRDAAYYEYFERLTCTWHPELQKKTAVFKIDGGIFSPMHNADI